MTDRTTVIGRVGQEPVTKATPKGDVVEFSVAHTPRLLGPDGSWSDGTTTWYRVSAWDRLGANAVRSLHTGQPVIVHGVVVQNQWTGRDGEVRRELRMKASAIGHDLNAGTATFLRGGGSGGGSGGAPALPPQAPAVQAQGQEQESTGRDWGGPGGDEPRAPAPAGWSTLLTAEEETPF